MEYHIHEEAPRVLVVDDEKVIREILADFLSMEGYWVRTAEDGAVALRELDKHPYDMVISDLKMPKMGGLELLESLTTSHRNVLCVIMTGFGTVETAIEAMKRGAYDYILKPFKVEEVVHIVQRGLEKQRLTQENFRLKEAISLYKVTEAISASLSLDEVLNNVLDMVVQEIHADLVTLLLHDEETQQFVERGRRTTSEPGLATAPGDLDLGALIDSARDDRPMLAHGRKVLRYFTHIPDATPVQSFLSLPLRIQQRVIGFLNVYSFTRDKKFDEGQRKLLSVLASRAAASIENARLYADLKGTFKQTIQGLARALDKMDRYTAGHSDRVTAYSRVVANRIGLSADEIETVCQSAMMHDIGKIGCHTNLNKPGQLSEKEYAIFRLHPGYGKEILEPITFLHPLVPGVHLHHERWDGQGYPLGIEGEQIPLIARILTVADAYDAMTSDRAYRRAMPHEIAMAEVGRCAKAQFDPQCVDAFEKGIAEFRQEKLDSGQKVPE